MKKKMIIILSLILLLNIFIGCDSIYHNKIINNLLMVNAKVKDFAKCGYRGCNYKVITDKGNFYIKGDGCSNGDSQAIFDELKGFYEFKKGQDKDLYINIVYNNNIYIKDDEKNSKDNKNDFDERIYLINNIVISNYE